jgi:predicted AAA+ superfamily ATPase
VSLDLPALAAEAEHDPTSFLRNHPPPVVVDEVQYAGGLFRHVKARIDADRRRRGQFILTGSQSFPLMKEVADSLAGRVGLIQLETLSLAEIRHAAPRLPIESIIIRGGYPELYDDPDLDAHDFYRAYVATYLERDVRALLNVGSLRDFERFLRACALRSAQVLNKSDLARDVGISPSTSNQWLSVLEASHQALLLEPWFANRSVSITKSPKLYLADTGLLCFLVNIRTADDLLASPYRGAVWETFVFAELRKRQTRAAGSWELFFWRDRQREVDFLVHRGGRFSLLEAKWTETPGPREAANMQYLAEVLGPSRVLDMQIVCRTATAFPFSPAGVGRTPMVRAVPIEEDGTSQ